MPPPDHAGDPARPQYGTDRRHCSAEARASATTRRWLREISLASRGGGTFAVDHGSRMSDGSDISRSERLRSRHSGRYGRPMGPGVPVGERHPGQHDELLEPGNDLRRGIDLRMSEARACAPPAVPLAVAVSGCTSKPRRHVGEPELDSRLLRVLSLVCGCPCAAARIRSRCPDRIWWLWAPWARCLSSSPTAGTAARCRGRLWRAVPRARPGRS
jgi:hypothetical protein